MIEPITSKALLHFLRHVTYLYYFMNFSKTEKNFNQEKTWGRFLVSLRISLFPAGNKVYGKSIELPARSQPD